MWRDYSRELMASSVCRKDVAQAGQGQPTQKRNLKRHDLGNTGQTELPTCLSSFKKLTAVAVLGISIRATAR